MLRPFQVNVGSFLTLNHDILPTAKVSELCECIEAVSGEKAEDQVLLTADGRQMDMKELIGSYSVGTEDKPLFVFYRSYINTAEPPPVLSRLPKRGGLQQQLEILKQRPSPALFQHQVALSKRLCEYAMEVGGVCGREAEGYGLQLLGWKTVLSNCSNLTGMFQKHHQLFQKAVEKFREDKPRNLELLQQFPKQVSLLQQLPIPSSLQKSSPSSLYDWISTHDEKNSLMDLSSECRKALEKVESERLEVALRSSEEIDSKSREVFDAKNKSMESAGDKINSERAELTGIIETIVGLSKNIQATSDKAFRSGDAKTIAVLVESHHKSLQLMAASTAQLEAIAMATEASKKELTHHIHARLKLVMQLQKKVADSNGQLVLLHEHIKLARKRFEILEQVCSTPQVLGEVFNEVCRRRAYNSALEKVMGETVSRLQRAREEEKKLRKSFHSNHGIHFVTTLFPELQDRVPDITFHSPKSLSKTHDDDFEAMCSLLPQDLRPSTQLATSVQLLTSPSLVNSEFPISPHAQVDIMVTPENSPGNSFKLIKDGSPRPAPPTTSDSTVRGSHDNLGDSENLKERLGQLELSNVDLNSKLQKNQERQVTLETRLEEKEASLLSTREKLRETEERNQELRVGLETLGEKEVALLSTREKLREAEKLVSSLQNRLAGLEDSRKAVESERVSHEHQALFLDQKNKELGEELATRSQELQAMSLQCHQLVGEKEVALKERKELRDKMQQLQSESTRAAVRAQEEVNELQTKLTQENSQLKERVKALQDSLSLSNSEQQRLAESSKQLELSKTELEVRLTELENNQVQRYEQEQNLQRETLRKHSSLTQELMEKDRSYEACQLQLKAREQELRTLQSQKEQLERDLKTLQQESRTLQNQREQVEEKVRTLQNQREQDLRTQKEQVVMEFQNQRDQAVEELRTLRDQDQKEIESLKAEQSRLQQRYQQAQATIHSQKARVDALQGKIEGKDRELSIKESELVSLREKHTLASEKAQSAKDKAADLQNQLNQKGPEIERLELKLKAAEEKVAEQETELCRQKETFLQQPQGEEDSRDLRIELQRRTDEIQTFRNELQRRTDEILTLREEKDKQKHDYETRHQQLEAKLQKTVRDNDKKMRVSEEQWKMKEEAWGKEKDDFIRQNMELDREVRELRRDTVSESPPGPSPTSSPAAKKPDVQRIPSSPSGSASSAALIAELAKVAMHSLQVGHIALFMSDQYNNYLALTVDSKTYYLDSDSVKNLQDIAIRQHRINLRRKLLIGRITGRLYMEVRKENNRLKVPVGSRLYKLQAEAVMV